MQGHNPESSRQRRAVFNGKIIKQNHGNLRCNEKTTNSKWCVLCVPLCAQVTVGMQLWVWLCVSVSVSRYVEVTGQTQVYSSGDMELAEWAGWWVHPEMSPPPQSLHCSLHYHTSHFYVGSWVLSSCGCIRITYDIISHNIIMSYLSTLHVIFCVPSTLKMSHRRESVPPPNLHLSGTGREAWKMLLSCSAHHKESPQPLGFSCSQLTSGPLIWRSDLSTERD